MVIHANPLFTVEQAAEVLQADNSYVRRALDSGNLPSLYMKDIFEFRNHKERTHKALKELTRISQELGGYEEMNSKPNPLSIV